MHLNQYYTEDLYSDRLVNSLSVEEPNLALDLGFGAGGLLHAAKRRWTNINLVGVDVDRKNVLSAKRDKLIDAIELNGFSSVLPEIILEKYGKVDLLVSNPPYFSKSLDHECKRILSHSGLLDCISARARYVPAELVFLAQNLRLLTLDGEIGIILPAGLISGEKWKGFREILFKEFYVSNVIQLPINSFKGTDAQTFILTISRIKKDKVYTVNVSHALCEKNYDITVDEAIARADFQYYESNNNLAISSELMHSDFSIFRGQLSHKDLKSSVENFIHTTEMPSEPQSKYISYNPVSGLVNANKGDILIARVGSRCLGRSVYIHSGSLPVSDCIIIIRPNNRKIGSIIWEKVSSDIGVNFLKDTSLGVGAKYITHQSIKELLLRY